MREGFWIQKAVAEVQVLMEYCLMNKLLYGISDRFSLAVISQKATSVCSVGTK